MRRARWHLLALTAIAPLLGAADCGSNKYTPTECAVWAESGGNVTGTVYMQGNKASFQAGGARSNIAYMNGADEVMVVDGPKAVNAASFDGETILITYLDDATFRSQGFENGTVVFMSDTYRTEFYYNSLCTAKQVAVGSVTLFTTVFPVGEPASL
jgi:hypothetical protein